MTHHFLLQPGTWLGEGNISFASSPETVRFFTRWKFVDTTAAGLVWLQEVELHGLDQVTRSIYTLSNITDSNFQITLASEEMGTVIGKGVITPTSIAWELRSQPTSEGWEIYELQEDGKYKFSSEYGTVDPYRTLIEGILWQKSISPDA